MGIVGDVILSRRRIRRDVSPALGKVGIQNLTEIGSNLGLR